MLFSPLGCTEYSTGNCRIVGRNIANVHFEQTGTLIKIKKGCKSTGKEIVKGRYG